jgi:hypothetical protein
MKITIPESQHEITIAQWQKLDLILKDENTNEMLKRFQVVSTLCDIPLEDMMKIKPNDVIQIYNQLIEVCNQNLELVKTFVVDGIEFGFIPDIEKMSTAEYMDLNEYFGTNIERTTAVLYRPIKKKSGSVYSIEEYNGTDEHIELIRKAPASAFTTSSVFFYNLGKELLIYTTEYLAKNLTQEEQTALYQNGVGTSQLIQSLKGIEQSFLKL